MFLENRSTSSRWCLSINKKKKKKKGTEKQKNKNKENVQNHVGSLQKCSYVQHFWIEQFYSVQINRLINKYLDLY